MMTADRPATEPRPCDICNNTGIDYLGRPCRLHGSYRAEATEGAAPRAEGLPLEDVDDLVQDIAGGIDGEPYLDRSGWERAHASLKVLAAAARRPSDERVPESEKRPVCNRFRHDEHCIDEPHA